MCNSHLYRILLLTTSILLLIIPTRSQGLLSFAESNGVGSIRCCHDWNPGYTANPANIFSNAGPLAYLAYSNPFRSELTHNRTVGAVYTRTVDQLGVHAILAGSSFYYENLYGLSYGRKLLPNLAIGVQVGAYHHRFSHSNWKAQFTLGMIYHYTEGGQLGILISPNPYQIDQESTLSPRNNTINIGVKIPWEERANLYFELEKTSGFRLETKFALDYRLDPSWLLMGGFVYPRKQISFGVHYSHAPFRIQFAYQHHWILGITPSLSIWYHFNHSKP